METESKLSASEKEIMDILWKKGTSMTVSDIFGELASGKWKYTTIATFLTRLVKKGVLQFTKANGQNHYCAAKSYDEYVAQQTENFVDELFGGSASKLIASLCREKVSDGDYAELVKLLQKYEGSGDER